MALPAYKLRTKIVESLQDQGFIVNGHVEPSLLNKEFFRNLHSHSKNEQISLQRKFIEENTDVVMKYSIDGSQINPEAIELELREVEEGTEEQILYRWWNLAWWSVPFQRAYGRQMRFLVWDKTHNAPFGLIGLQSPILKMSVRDEYLKIPKEDLDLWINKSMQAQRLGALPPYNQLLGGKMVALAVSSNELRRCYKRKYKDSRTLLMNRKIDPDLLFITTTSAFGRSSIYNRLKYHETVVAENLGFTKGSGTFHISQEVYLEIQKYLINKGIDVSTTFGNGPSRKLKLLDTAFSLLELPEYTYHNVQREFFLFPIAKNLHNVISKNIQPKYYNRKLVELTDFWKSRWCIPRSIRSQDWKTFKGSEFIAQAKAEMLNQS